MCLCVCVCVCVWSVASIISESLRPHGLQPARLLCPWDAPGEDTGVGWRFLLQGMFPTEGSNLRFQRLLHLRPILYRGATGETQSDM